MQHFLIPNLKSSLDSSAVLSKTFVGHSDSDMGKVIHSFSGCCNGRIAGTAEPAAARRRKIGNRQDKRIHLRSPGVTVQVLGLLRVSRLWIMVDRRGNLGEKSEVEGGFAAMIRVWTQSGPPSQAGLAASAGLSSSWHPRVLLCESHLAATQYVSQCQAVSSVASVFQQRAALFSFARLYVVVVTFGEDYLPSMWHWHVRSECYPGQAIKEWALIAAQPSWC